MAQLNVEIEDALYKQVKYACIDEGTSLQSVLFTASLQ